MRPSKPSGVELPHKDFAKRFTEVCDANPDIVPGYNSGRLIWFVGRLEKQFGIEVTRETVRKWLTGLVIPRNEKLRALSKILNVDEGWLAFGIASDVEPERRPAKILSESGAASIVAGFIQLSGGRCALPEDGNAGVDIYAILGKRQRAIAVSLAEPETQDKLRFAVTNNYGKCRVVGVVPTGLAKADLYLITADQIEKHGDKRGPYVELLANRRDGKWMIGRSPLARITDFQADLTKD